MLDQIQSPDLTLRLVIEDCASLPVSHRDAYEIRRRQQQIPTHKRERGGVVLATSVGAVKAALHRGRKWLEAAPPPPSRRPAPSEKLVDRFIGRLNEADLQGLLALMLDGATIDMVGYLLEVGRRQFEAKGSWLWQAVNVHPDMPPELRPPKFFNERVTVQGEPMMAGFIVHGNAKILMAVARFEEIEEQIARIRSYNFNPELLQEIGTQLGYTVGQMPYRFPTPAPGIGSSNPRHK